MNDEIELARCVRVELERSKEAIQGLDKAVQRWLELLSVEDMAYAEHTRTCACDLCIENRQYGNMFLSEKGRWIDDDC